MSKGNKKLPIALIVCGLLVIGVGIFFSMRLKAAPKYTFDEITNHQMTNVRYVISNEEEEVDLPKLMGSWESKIFVEVESPPSMDEKQWLYSFHDSDYETIFAVRDFEELHMIQILMDGKTTTYEYKDK